MPFFVYHGVILAHLAAFKEHCAFDLWAERAKPAHDGMGGFGRLTRLADLPDRADLRKRILAAAKKIESGERTTAWTRKPRDPKEPEARSRNPTRARGRARRRPDRAAGTLKQ